MGLLPFGFKAVVIALVIAIPLTMFLGQVSSQTVLDGWALHVGPWPYWLLDWLGNVALVTITLFGLEYLRHTIVHAIRQSAPTGQNSETQYRLLDDVPVGSHGTDEFERDDFVKTLSRTIVLPPKANSLVLALESAWGSGKSSVLDLLCRELVGHPDNPLIVRFNPWLATGQDRIFRAFFSQFSASLLKKGEKSLATGLISFGEAIEDLLPAGARVFPRIGFQHIRRLVGRIPIIDLEGERENLNEAVSKVNRPIVVIIDDIDRLAPSDIRIVFQLVKAIASFPRVAYLLAFDPEPIDSALSFGGNSETGRQFRDKIVQANVVLPKIRYRTRKQYLTSKLNERLKFWRFDLDQREERVLERAIPRVLSALRTPRDMKRVLNKMLLTADNVRNEVNIADVLVLETLHAKFPKIANIIRQNPRVVDPSGYGDEETSSSEFARISREQMDEKKEKSEKLKELTDLYPDDRDVLSSLLTFTFPTMFDDMPDAEDHDPAGDRRISIHENLLKLLYQGLHGEILSANEAEMFLSDESSRGAIVADVLEARSLPEWLAHLRTFVKSVNIAVPASLLQELAIAVNALYERSHTDASGDARWLLLDILEATPGHERMTALEQLLGNPRTVSVGEEVLLSLLQDAGLWDDGEYFGLNNISDSATNRFSTPVPEELDQLRQLWLATVRELGIKKIVTVFPNAGGVLFRWGQLSEPPYIEVAAELNNALEDTRIGLAFLNSFPAGMGLSGTEKIVLDTTWSKLRALLEAEALPESTKTKFREHFEERYRQKNESDTQDQE